MSFSIVRKIKFEKNPTLWHHHRGGWTHAHGTLKPLVVDDGTLFVSALEELILDEVAINEPWIGFIHQVPENNLLFYPDLRRLTENALFLQSLKVCRGIFVLSSYVKKYLQQNLPQEIKVPIVQLFYPITPFPDNKLFDWKLLSAAPQRNIYFIGEFLRDFQSIYDLRVPPGYKKFLIKAPDVDLNDLYDLQKRKYELRYNDSVTLIKNAVPEEEYDKILSSSVVFLRLFDAAATTTILECIGRGTPLLINKLPGVVEYLGEAYPLYYNTLEEASKLIEDDTNLKNASEYLKALDKKKFQPQSFLEGFVNSSIYRSLPLPESVRRDREQTLFPKFSLTVMICCYKRVKYLDQLLTCFTQQQCEESFEILIWNNNHETQTQVGEIVKRFENKLTVRLIQSSKNYYCIIRLSIAKIMHSDLLLICDDDVIPNSNYISTFLSSFRKYGPRAVLCFRGHVFKHHTLNHEEPEQFWLDDEHYDEHKMFFDQEAEDRQIHFVHACNCLIPRSLLLEISAFDLPCPEFILVDDYWMSFVFSHHLNVPLWKIKSPNAFQSTPCADDENIAMYHSKAVREQRVNFYIYHMKEGWPASRPLASS